jgi:hypothetical protein
LVRGWGWEIFDGRESEFEWFDREAFYLVGMISVKRQL